jgi:hypothetical protein
MEMGHLSDRNLSQASWTTISVLVSMFHIPVRNHHYYDGRHKETENLEGGVLFGYWIMMTGRISMEGGVKVSDGI